MNSRHRRLSFLLCPVMASLSVAPVLAQNVTGSVSGTITDASGAVLPNAAVSVRNVDTGVATSTTANGDGVYSVRFLPIGRYSVTISAAGFTQQTIPPFTLEINQTAKIDGKLSAGGSDTSIQVDTTAPILNTNDSSLGIALSTNEIANIPLNGRNFSSVTIFQPGAVVTDPQGLTGTNAIERSQQSNGVASINGNRNQANNYTLDGADQNEPQNNLIAYNPAPDALDEVRVISANAPASYGNANGGAVVSILKSGTNQFHGSVYGYLENDNLNANTWGNKHHDTAADFTPRNPYTQSIFGGTLGGPILHDKLFFFVDYEGVRQHTGGFQNASVLTQDMRNGNFSVLYANSGTQLYDSQNNYAAYANNQVPILNPVAKYLFAHPELYPLPNVSPNDGLIGNNFRGPQRSFVVNNQGDIKISYSKGASNKFNAFYAQSNANDFTTALIPVAFPSPNQFPTKLGGGNWIHTFSPSIVNEARVTFTRVRWDQGVPTDPSGVFGLNGNSIVGVPFGVQQYSGFSDQSFGATDPGTSANPQQFRDNTFNYYENLTWQRGKHLLSFGVQAIRYQQNYVNSSNFGFLGQMIYSGVYTSNPNVADGGGGYNVADFVLNRIKETKIASPLGRISQRQWRTSGYVQDDWKASDKLTLNLGLRYEFDQPWFERHNKTANVLLATGQPIYAGSVPAGAPAGAGVCPTRACYDANYTQFQPRIGFAYQASPRTVVRGGYGATSFFEGYSFNQRLTTSPPFASGADTIFNAPSTTSPGSPSSVEAGFNQTQNNNPSGYSVWPQNTQPAYIHQYNLTTEFALNNALALTVGYLGESGQHLADYRNGNQLTLAQAQRIATIDPDATLPSDQAPYFNLVGQSGGLLITESNAGMNYNGAQVSLRQRATHGLEYTVNYTYAKSLTNSAGDYGQPGISGQNGSFQDGYNGYADYGPAGQDIRHNVNFVGVYAVPFGRGQAYGAGVNRVMDLVAGGWKVSSSVLLYSGLPVTINAPGSSNTSSYGTQRANHYRKLVIRDRSTAHWFGTDPSATPCTAGGDNGVCAYGISPPNTFGTASVNSERAPGYKQFDTSAFKDFHVTESQSLGFRADFFNILNMTSLRNPQNDSSSQTFGQITDVRSPPRQIQFSAHYNF